MARSHTRTRTHTHAHTHIETQRQTLISDIERIVVRVVIKQSIFLGVGGVYSTGYQSAGGSLGNQYFHPEAEHAR